MADFAADWECWMPAGGSVRHMSPSCEGAAGQDAEAFTCRPDFTADSVIDDDGDVCLLHPTQQVAPTAST